MLFLFLNVLMVLTVAAHILNALMSHEKMEEMVIKKTKLTEEKQHIQALTFS